MVYFNGKCNCLEDECKNVKKTELDNIFASICVFVDTVETGNVDI